MIATDENLALYGILTITIGSLMSWIGCFILYGFGRLIHNSEIIVQALDTPKSDNEPRANTQPKGQDDTIATILEDMVKDPDIPYWCSDCGHKGPYDGVCPKCGGDYIIENPNYNK